MNPEIFVSILALSIAACTNLPDTAARDGVPNELKPNANETLAMIVSAKGVQIYECRASNDQPATYEWVFVAPEAELFDPSGKQIGRHFAGPSWDSADGSKIVGTLKGHYDAPRADAIPWLLLATRSVGSRGSFSEITSVQRVNTVGGVAPKGGCSQSDVGVVVRMPLHRRVSLPGGEERLQLVAVEGS
jgi:hypothetical protein